MIQVPIISICIPTYNRFNYLKQLIDNIQNQIANHFIEIIISQDRFKDGNFNKEIYEYGTELCQRFDNVKYALTTENFGLGKNWNACIELATGKYSIILGDDDLFSDDGIDNFIKLVDIDADVIFSNHYLIDETGTILPSSVENSSRFNRGDLSEGFVLNIERKIWQNAIPISASLIKTDILKKVRFKDHLNTPEIDFFLRAWNSLKLSFFFTPQYLVKYRVHIGSATSGGLKIHQLFLELADIQVTDENSEYKKQFLNRLSVPSVSNFLKENNFKNAKQIFKSSYYFDTSKFKYKSILQRLIINIPFLNKFI